ncbi:AAA family ATPase [Brucella sp. 10RB9210]|nr:AAA family ATPase [Brucella sp. 10RB9210]
MVGTRQLERIMSHAAEARAKVVLVGDIKQLQSIEAGAAFRSIHERHGGVEIHEVRRQREDWQRDATRELATGRTGNAIHAYDNHGMVHVAESREQARTDLIDRWDRERQAAPECSRIILTHTNAEVRALNEAAREKMRQAGDLGEDVRVTVDRGDGQRNERSFASGDRVMFLANERGLGVKNGTLGTIQEVSTQSMTVRIDDGCCVAFDLKDYNRIDHGYAATIHKAQGMTVDRLHVLATPGMDAHGSYVALSRHRDGVDLHYGRDDFSSHDRLVNTLSRDRSKDMATDYERADAAKSYAELRGITFRERVAQIMRKLIPERLRDAVDGMLDGARQHGDGAPGTNAVKQPERESTGKPAAEQQIGEDAEAALRRAHGRAFVRHARAVDAIFKAQDRGGSASLEQMQELHDARAGFEELRPQGSRDAEAVYKRNPEFAAAVASGAREQALSARHALQQETEIRQNSHLRADRFVEHRQKLDRNSQQQYQAGDMAGYKASRSAMGDMANSLQRDPQLESILANRKRDLGIGGNFERGRSLGRELAFHHGLDLGRGRGIGL